MSALTRSLVGLTRSHVMRTFVRRSHETSVPEKYKKFATGTMADALLPSGSWKEAYEQLQSKYNKQLAFGVVFFVTSLAVLCNTVELVLPPPKN